MVRIQGAGSSGSFRRPPEMQDSIREAEKRRLDEAEKRRLEDHAPETEPEPVAEPALEEEQEGEDLSLDEESKKLDPVKALRDLGIELTEDDLHSLVFKGRLVKTGIPIVRVGTKTLTADFQTLNGEEYDWIDEILVEDARTHAMSQEGYETRRSMYITCFGIAKMNGKPIRTYATDVKEGRVKLVDGKIPPKDKARLDYEVLAKLSPPVLNKMMSMHGRFTLALNYLVRRVDDPLSVLP